ncbi:MAG: tetratricopeptide repeat protein [Endomicrobiia bacterium]
MKEKLKEELFETGKFYLINNRYDEALKIFEQLYKENKNDPEILYHIGLVKEAQNEIEEAKDIFLKVLELQPKHKLAKKHLDKLLGINDEESE